MITKHNSHIPEYAGLGTVKKISRQKISKFQDIFRTEQNKHFEKVPLKSSKIQ